MTTNLEVKASLLLSSGAVHIVWATDTLTTAKVRGDHGIYDIRWSRLTGWNCTCAAYGRCSHIEAVSKVTSSGVAPSPRDRAELTRHGPVERERRGTWIASPALRPPAQQISRDGVGHFNSIGLEGRAGVHHGRTDHTGTGAVR